MFTLSLIFSLVVFVQAGFVNTPSATNPAIQCDIMNITWTTPDPGPVTIWLHFNESQYHVEEIGQFASPNSSCNWLVDVPGGMTFQFGMLDGAGVEDWSDEFTVEPSNDAACIAENSGYSGLISSEAGVTVHPHTFTVALASSTLSSQQPTTSPSTSWPSSSTGSSSSTPSLSSIASSLVSTTTAFSTAPNVRAIAGGTVGGLFAFASIGVILYVLLRRRKRVRAPAEASRPYDISAYDQSPPEYRPVAPPSEAKALIRSGIHNSQTV